MAKYQEFDTVLLKDGRIVTIVEVLGPGAYIADVGHSPRDWSIIWDLTDDDILRLAASEEIDRHVEESNRQLKEQGYV
ncbi:MAG: hypothetical protein HFF76_13085 [Oscillospiraceae bacterium]|jgi:hypothetical protein|nr:hypothetical protein [Oscillospiraceae bacterium]